MIIPEKQLRGIDTRLKTIGGDVALLLGAGQKPAVANDTHASYVGTVVLQEISELYKASRKIGPNSLSERAKAAREWMRRQPKPPEGRPGKTRKHVSEFSGRLDQAAAEKFGLGNRVTLNRVLYVVDYGTPELIAAMDAGVEGGVSVRNAYGLACERRARA